MALPPNTRSLGFNIRFPSRASGSFNARLAAATARREAVIPEVRPGNVEGGVGGGTAAIDLERQQEDAPDRD
jgi:hypothetical protein